MAFLSCDEFRAILADEVAGADAGEQERGMRSHLGSCEACAAHSGQILWQDRVLAELAARARLEPLVARIRESLASTQPVEFAAVPPLRIRTRRPRWGRAAVAAALFLAALGAFFAFRPANPGPVASEPPKGPPRNEVVQNEVPREEPPVPPPVVEEKKAPDPAPDPQPPPAKIAKEDPPKKDALVKSPAPEVEPVTGPSKTPEVRVPAVDMSQKKDIVLTPRTADIAVRDGMAYLRNRSAAIEAAKIHHDLRYDELVLWTYLHGGMAEGDPEFQKVLKRILDQRLLRTYAVALQAMVLEELDRVTYQSRIQQCAQFLVDNQGKNGQWGYGDPSIFAEDVVSMSGGPKPAAPGVKKFGPPSKESLAADGKPKVLQKVGVKKKRPGPDAGDHSNSMYAALGLRACFDAGIMLPTEVVQLAQKSWREAQIKGDGGWCYGRHEGHKGYGSMTAGGVGSLVIYDYLLGQDWKRDRAVKTGLEWLEKKFSVAYNPGIYEHGAREENTQAQYFYYMYALERAAILYDTPAIGKHDWYKTGSDFLLGCQRQDGSWAAKEGGNEVSDTCFAILFLRKATRALPDVASGRPK